MNRKIRVINESEVTVNQMKICDDIVYIYEWVVSLISRECGGFMYYKVIVLFIDHTSTELLVSL